MTPATLDRRAIETLRSRFHGELVTPEDSAYDDRRRIWNRMIDRRPALIARVASSADARHALLFAREHGLPIAIRGGGHNVSGSASVDGGLVIDHSMRRGVRVDRATRRVEVEPGALLGDVDAATARDGLVVPIGINTTTGIAGLTLGGGIGWLMRAHGLTADHLLEADLLTAGGDVVRVTADEQPELLWGLRGGGGNFGIVTRFVFEAVPFDGSVFGGLVLYPMEEGGAVLRRYRDWAETLPRTVTTIVALRSVLPIATMPAELHGRRVVGIVVCGIGGPEDDDALRREITGFGTVLLDAVGRKPFAAQQALFDASVPAGNGYYWKSHYLEGLPDAAIDALVELHQRAPQPWSYSLVPRLGGAIRDLPDDATAYPFRDPPHLVNINGITDNPADDDKAIAWVRETFEAMAPFSTGGVYVNFVGNEGEDRVRAAYGPAYGRLAALKARWDPDNVFSVNQNIRPVASS